jgi:hypothetical protein
MCFQKFGTSTIKAIFSVIQTMGRIPWAQSIEIQNPTRSPFSNVDLVWKDGLRHGGQNKMVIEIAYIPHARVFEFLQGERKDMQTSVEWKLEKILSHQ